MKKLFAIISILALPFFAASAQTVGYVDTEKVLSCIAEYVNAQNELNKLAEQYKADVQADVDAIDILYRNYMSKKATLTSAQQQAKEKEIIEAEKKVKEKEDSYFGEDGVLTQRSTKLISPIQEIVENAIAKVAEARGCAIVIDLTVTTGIVYRDEKYNITNAVIDYLRK